MDLYSRFKEVKTYYNFVFNPNEEKMMEEAKAKISREYFPINGRKPKARRSVAQKYIRHFIQLGVDPYLIADLMLFNIEVAQTFSSERVIRSEAFYKSIHSSFVQAVQFVDSNGLFANMNDRIHRVVEEAFGQDWFNTEGFERVLNSRGD